jgi:hypothetical protein
MMMQSRQREHGSSGELDVFGATSYFAGLPPPAPDDADCRRPSSATTEPSADRLYFQATKVVVHPDTRTKTMEDNSFRGPHQQQQQPGLHGHADRHDTNKQLQVVAAKRQQPPYSGKSKLAALLSFMVSPSPSPRASFRKEINKQEAPSTTTTTRLLRQAEAAPAAGGEKETSNKTYKAAANSPSSSSRERSSSMQLHGLFGAHDDDDDDEELDLGVATGDRRLQGITVVRGIGGGEERWVVRCCVPVPGGGAWDDEEHREKMLLDAAESASSEQNVKDELLVEVEQLQGDEDDDGNVVDPAPSSWDSDSSSDLFDLDLEYR